MVKTKEYEAFAKELKAYEKVVKAEYAGIEDAVSVKIRECEAPVSASFSVTVRKSCADSPFSN